MKRQIQIGAAIVVLAALAVAALAHPPVSAMALVQWTADGRVTVRLEHDAPAFALNETPIRIADAPMYEFLNSPPQDMAAVLTDGRERMAAGLQLTADGVAVQIEITEAPSVESFQRWREENPAGMLPVRMEFAATATLPKGAREFRLRFPPVLGDVILSVQAPGAEPIAIPILAEETTPPINTGFAASESAQNTDGTPAETPAATPALSLGTVVWRYLVLGFTHIVPEGPDHVLFVLGLFLLRPQLKTVLWQITAFTIAHTFTLTLTAMNIVGLPASFVEPAIAASVAFVGIENLCTTRVHSWRVAVAFFFGLIHGMGVATVFTEAGFPRGQLVSSLAAFTVGVEAGHLATLLAAFLLLGWWRERKWFRSRVTIPGSLLISAIALVWLFQRLS